MPNKPTPHKVKIDRELVLAQLSQMIHDDFPGCNGSGSVFCVGCIALRATHALIEVYEEVAEEADIDQISDDVLESYKGGDPDIENVVTIH